MEDYRYTPESAYAKIAAHWQDFMKKTSMSKVVLGVSGGKDSSCCAALAAKTFGPENVYGVMMPCGEQADIGDSKRICDLLRIHSLEINIGDAFSSLRDAVENNGIEASADTKINLPPRLRMAALYAVAQSVNSLVLNCDNLEEIICGYYTLFGDGAGSYGPLRNLTVPEVVELGKWLGIPDDLMDKTPGDGLQPLGDEARLGLSYSDLHKLIRFGEGTSELKERAASLHSKNKFKTEIVRIPAPDLGYPSFFDQISSQNLNIAALRLNSV